MPESLAPWVACLMYLSTSSSGVSLGKDIAIGWSSFSRICLVLGSRSKTSTALPYLAIRRSERFRHRSASGYSMIWSSGKGTAARCDVLHGQHVPVLLELLELQAPGRGSPWSVETNMPA